MNKYQNNGKFKMICKDFLLNVWKMRKKISK